MISMPTAAQSREENEQTPVRRKGGDGHEAG